MNFFQQNVHFFFFPRFENLLHILIQRIHQHGEHIFGQIEFFIGVPQRNCSIKNHIFRCVGLGGWIAYLNVGGRGFFSRGLSLNIPGPALNTVGQLFLTDRFGLVIIHTSFQQGFFFICHGVCRKGNDRDCGTAFQRADFPRSVQAIHARHLNIHQN